MITVKKSEYNKAKLRKLFREASQQYIQITEEEAAELGLIEQEPTGPTGEQEPETPTGNTEPQEPTREEIDKYNYINCDFGVNGIGYKILSLNEPTVKAHILFDHNNVIIPDKVTYNNIIFKITEFTAMHDNISNYCNTIKFNKYIDLNNYNGGLYNFNTNYFYVDELNPYICAIDGNLYNKEMNKLLAIKKIINYQGECLLTNDFTIPDFVTDINDGLFTYVKNVYFNNNIINLPAYVFSMNNEYIKLSNKIKIILPRTLLNCKNLKKIILPQELEQILTDEFNYRWSDSIENITVYNSNIVNYTYIKHVQRWHTNGSIAEDYYENSNVYVFGILQNLKNIYVIDSNPVPLNEDIFTDGKYFTLKVYVPKGCKSIYENTEGWNKFYNIIEVEE